MDFVGHLFVVQGDLLKCQADAIALSGEAGSIGSRWFGEDPKQPTALPADLISVLQPERHMVAPGVRCRRLDGTWRGTALFHLDVGGHRDTDAAWYEEAAVDFVRQAAAAVGRGKRVAMPAIGLGRGGASEEKLLERMIDCLVKAARDHGVDVIFVILPGNRARYAAMQRMRRALEAEIFRPLIDAMPGAPGLVDEAVQAFDHAVKPVIFVGAGISADANLPGWTGLLMKLANLEKEDDKDAFKRLAETDALAAADVVIRRRWPDKSAEAGERALAAAIREVLTAERRLEIPALAHLLLATLPADGYVTTNYDRLLEGAVEAARGECRVLPRQHPDLELPWVLKLHGTLGEVDADGDPQVVLTRRSFLRFDGRSRTLLSLVEAAILLRELFVFGFSLRDPNFFRAIDGVRQVRERTAGSRPDLALFHGFMVGRREHFLGDLWPDAKTTWFGDVEPGARLQLLLLDWINVRVERSAHLLDARSTPLLTAEERKVAEALKAVQRALPDDAARHAGFPALRRLLRDYGVGKTGPEKPDAT